MPDGDDTKQASPASELASAVEPQPHAERAAAPIDLLADPGREAPKSQASFIVAMWKDVSLFRSQNGEPFITFDRQGHRCTTPLRSDAFRTEVAARYYRDTGVVPSSKAVNDAIGVLAGQCAASGRTHPVFVRVANVDDVIYIDLANVHNDVAVVTPDGYEIVTNPPVRFFRPEAMKALPRPETGGDVSALRHFVNVTGEHFILLLVWVLAAMRGVGPFPVLDLFGSQGSAKSCTAKFVRGVFDPHGLDVRSEPQSVRDLMISVSHSWCLAFDNLSSISGWLSDALCRLATGGGFATRLLYSNDGEKCFEGQRPVILNGIEEVVVRPDLLQRSLMLELPAIASSGRRTEAVLQAEFRDAHPKLFGAMLDALARALRALPTVQLTESPRMADFALWGEACEVALGWPSGTFRQAYELNQREGTAQALDASLVAAPVISLVKDRSHQWEGTAGQLLRAVNAQVDEATRRNPRWPKTGKGMANAVRRIETNLKEIGIELDFGRDNSRERNRIVTIRRVEPGEQLCSVSRFAADTTGVVGGNNPDDPFTVPPDCCSEDELDLGASPGDWEVLDDADDADGAGDSDELGPF